MSTVFAGQFSLKQMALAMMRCENRTFSLLHVHMEVLDVECRTSEQRLHHILTGCRDLGTWTRGESFDAVVIDWVG